MSLTTADVREAVDRLRDGNRVVRGDHPLWEEPDDD